MNQGNNEKVAKKDLDAKNSTSDIKQEGIVPAKTSLSALHMQSYNRLAEAGLLPVKTVLKTEKPITRLVDAIAKQSDAGVADYQVRIGPACLGNPRTAVVSEINQQSNAGISDVNLRIPSGGFKDNGAAENSGTPSPAKKLVP